MSADEGAPESQGTWDVSLPLHPDEAEALRQFRAAVTNDAGLLSTWDDAVDPCQWEAIDCDCFALYPPPPEPYPCPAPEDAHGDGFNHVYRIDFGPRKPSNKRLTGVLTPYLGNLTEARQYYLHVNKFSGGIPPELGRLRKMQRLLLRDNLLTGTLPPEIAAIDGMKDLYFDVNSLEGAIPDAWCDLVERPSSILNVIQPSNNPYLCGEVPRCLWGKWLNEAHVVGTYLIYSDEDSGRVSGYCDGTPPTCDPPACGVSAPAVVGSLDTFKFTFSAFTDAQSGMRSYEWGLGNSPGMADARALEPVAINASEPVEDFEQRFEASGLALRNGQRYYVTVVGTNKGGPPLSSNVSSATVLVDSTPPAARGIVLTAGEECDPLNPLSAITTVAPSSGSSTHGADGALRACWQPFVEEESWIESYEVKLVKVGGAQVGETVSVSANETSVLFENLALVDGVEMHANVSAHNAAMGTGYKLSTVGVRVVTPASGDDGITIWVTAVVAGVLLILAIAYISLQRLRLRRQYESLMAWRDRQLAQAAAMRQVLRGVAGVLPVLGDRKEADAHAAGPRQHALQVSQVSDDGYSALTSARYVPRQGDPVAFVVTDLEGSTAMSVEDAAAYRMVQDTHDRIVRAALDELGGTEMATQGDSFEIAFPSAAVAVRFCVDVQEKLLLARWPDRVLQLPSCEQVRSPDGALMFSGPRVRMGVHLAEADEYEAKLHDMSRHLVFKGPGFELARAVGDMAHGGQVLLTHATAKALAGAMHVAGNPTIECVGAFEGRVLQTGADKPPDTSSEADTAPGATWLYTAHPYWGSPIPWRTFAPRFPNVRRVSTEPPTLNLLVLHANYRSAATLDADARDKEGTDDTGDAMNGDGAMRSNPVRAVCALRLCADSPLGESPDHVPEGLAVLADEILCSVAQQFGGYVSDDGGLALRGVVLVGFACPAAAVACASALQLALTFAAWPYFLGVTSFGEARSALSQPGPRFALAVHAAPDMSLKILERKPGKGSHGGRGYPSSLTEVSDEGAGLSDVGTHEVRISVGNGGRDGDSTAGDSTGLPQPAGYARTASGRVLGGAAFGSATSGGDSFTVPSFADSAQASGAATRRIISGSGVRAAIALARCAWGGQTVVSEAAWKQAQRYGLAPRTMVVSLGDHLLESSAPAVVHSLAGPGVRGASLSVHIDEDGRLVMNNHPREDSELPRAVALIEVSPAAAAGRKFPPPRLTTMVSPSYYQSPVPETGVTIVFCRAQLAGASISHSTQNTKSAAAGSTEGLAAMHHWEAVCREALAHFGGYECKMPEMGKFTVAFQSMHAALAFGASLSEHLLATRDDPNGMGALVSVQIGMAHGADVFRKPLATGRADYFGATANLAARTMGQAQPGQAVAEMTFTDESVLPVTLKWDAAGECTCAAIAASDGSVALPALRLRNIGACVLKGVTGDKMLVQVQLAEAPAADFGRPKGWVAAKVRHVVPTYSSTLSKGSAGGNSFGEAAGSEVEISRNPLELFGAGVGSGSHKDMSKLISGVKSRALRKYDSMHSDTSRP